MRAAVAGSQRAGDVPAGDVRTGDVPAGDVPAGDVPAGEGVTKQSIKQLKYFVSNSSTNVRGVSREG